MLPKPREGSISEKELLHTDDSDPTSKNDTTSEKKQGEAIRPAVLFWVSQPFDSIKSSFDHYTKRMWRSLRRFRAVLETVSMRKEGNNFQERSPGL